MKRIIFILFMLPLLMTAQVISKQIVRIQDLGGAIRFVQIDSSYIDLQKTSVGFFTLYPLPQKSIQFVPIAGGSNNYTFSFLYDAITPLYASQYVLADTLNAWMNRNTATGGSGGGGGPDTNIYNSDGTIADGTNRVVDVQGTLTIADTSIEGFDNFYSFIGIGDSIAFPNGTGGFDYQYSNGAAQYSLFSNGNDKTAFSSVSASATGGGLGAVSLASDVNTNEAIGALYAYDTSSTGLLSWTYYQNPVTDEYISMNLTEQGGFAIYPYLVGSGGSTYKQSNTFAVYDSSQNLAFQVSTAGTTSASNLSATTMKIVGTNGNGHINLKHQASDASATGSSTALFADANGDLKYKNDNLYYTTLKTSGNTADREYRFPDSSGTVALLSNLGGGGLTKGTTTIANSASGNILYDSSGILSSSPLFTWDRTNKRLGVNISPSTTLDVNGNSTMRGYINITSGNFIRLNNAANDAYLDASIGFLNILNLTGSFTGIHAISANLGTRPFLISNGAGGSPQVGFMNEGSSADNASLCFYCDYGGGYRAGASSTNIIKSSTGNLIFYANTSTGGSSGGVASFTPTERMRMSSTGQLGIGEASPTANVHIKTGTATANTAPLKITTSSAALLTTPEAGAIEVLNDTLYYTGSSANRRQLTQSLYGSATLDFGSTNAQNSADLTIAIAGASDGDIVALGVPNASVNANTSYSAWVSASNTVTVRFNNYSSGSVDPASGTFKVRVIKN